MSNQNTTHQVQSSDKGKQPKEDFYANLKKIDRVPFRKLFRFADRREKMLMLFGSIAALISGAALPVMAIIFGNVSNDFITTNDLIATAGKYSISFLVIGVISFLGSYLSFSLWMISGETQGLKYRKAYFRSLIKQEIAFYDAINPNEISSRVTNECFEIQQGMGEKVSTYCFSISMTIVGFLIGFIKGWQLALVLLASVPCTAIAGGAFVLAIQKVQRVKNEAYAEAGAVAEECLNAIRTVTALAGHEKEHGRYHKLLLEAKQKVIRFILNAGLSMGMMNFFTMAAWALGFYYGSKLVENQTTNPLTGDPYTTGDVFTIFFAILMGSSSIGQLAPCMKAFASAKEAAARAFKIIDKKSEIDINDPKGLKPEKVIGEFEFDKVEFCYPMKKDKMVLKKVSFAIKKNQKTAFVGESGCGKTTSMQLIERFYDVTHGSIKLDGNDIRDINLFWLRSNIGYVGQEPVLFATSIRENMRFAKENATDDEIWESLKKANAYEFVQQLPDKLDSYVGMSGAQLSGGQKQRLAIARAILKNPPILLLDEATSALDRKNEREIQKTLDEISTGRTTIVIAHRLSTIQNADHIIVFDHGVIVEEGKHEELIEKKGRYYELQRIQLIQQQQGEEQEKKKEEEAEKIQQSSKNIDAIDPKKPNEVVIDINSKKESSHDLQVSKAKQGKKKLETKNLKATLFRLFNYNKGERWPFYLAVSASIVNGALFPLLSVYMSNLLGILSFPDAPDFRSEANRFCLYFLINAIVGLFCNLITASGYSYNGETLTLKLRSDLFKKLLKMNIGWYDDPANNPGGLNTKLSTDTIQINRLAGASIGICIGAVSTLVTGLVIAFISSWQITLCTIGFLPILIFAGKMQSKVAQGFSAKTDEAYRESGAFIAEAVVNMRTVASFGREEILIKNYDEKLREPVSLAVKHGNQSGLAFGFSQFTTFGKYAYVFIIGAVFMNSGDVTYVNMFKSIFAIMFAAMGIGQAFQYLPDLGEAQNAAESLFRLLDYKPEIDLDDNNGKLTRKIEGKIELKNVWFKYPSRENYILKDFSLKIDTSSKVAFVGPSGCGKSTIIGLLLRFYNPERGEILVDGIDIKQYNLLHLRRSFGYVSQEPTLFNSTIEDNIRYTKDNATEEEIRLAAKEANCLKFIEANEFEAKLDDPAKNFGTGFKRVVGPKGSQISGGQKQRIAIARAILPKPNILLLDEATSALDAENEKVVQESLDSVMKGKTSIIVAHRISTIKDSNQILVFNNGTVVEQGSYEELTNKQGFFYKLERGQPL